MIPAVAARGSDFYIILARRIGEALIAGLLFLATFQLPVYVPRGDVHDSGSQAAYEYWTLHGVAYGKDIIQNVGPLGFLSYPRIYTGLLDKIKLPVNVFLTGCFVLVFWRSSRRLPAGIRAVFLLLGVAVEIAPDVVFYLLFLLVSRALMFAAGTGLVLPAAFLLALLALTKGTCFFIALFIVSASAAGNILSRRFTFAFLTAAGFAIFFLALWGLAGQSVANLPAFARAMASFSSGYNEALAIFEPGPAQVFGVLALAGGMLSILPRLLCGMRETPLGIPGLGRQLLLLATEAFILFVTWKHGFVRADDHVMIFFQYVIFSTIWILFGDSPAGGNASKNLRRLPVSLGIGVIIASFAGMQAMGRDISPAAIVTAAFGKISGTYRGIVDIRGRYDRLDAALKKSIAGMQLPKTRSLAGREPVSYFGALPAAMLYNGLNYVSTPSTISFASWNEWIMEADATFFRDDNRAPAFLLFDLRTVDDRLLAQDDSLAQLEILHRYEVVDAELGNIVLRRIKGRGLLSREVISERDYKVGEWIDVPQHSPNPVWVRAHIAGSFAARLIAFAYKPPQYAIELLMKTGELKTHKFIPRMAVTGFLIDPFIAENHDVLIARSSHKYPQSTGDTNPGLSEVVKFRIACGKERLEAFCGREATVTFEGVRGLALGEAP